MGFLTEIVAGVRRELAERPLDRAGLRAEAGTRPAPLPWNANEIDWSNVSRVSKNVLFVLPCTPGYAPVASVYQPWMPTKTPVPPPT